MSHRKGRLRSRRQRGRRSTALQGARLAAERHRLVLETLEERRLLAIDFLDDDALLDFGDLPEGPGLNYRTTLTDDDQVSGPIHLLVPDVYLGGNVDAEEDGQPSEDALGDDEAFGENIFGNVLATSDEDGVNLTSYRDSDGKLQTNMFYPGAVSYIDVHANVDGYLSAWIDYNGDGDFHDVNEQIADADMLSGGSNLLTLVVPLDAEVGETYARFRFTSYSGDLGPDGVLDNWVVPDGEVEDYRLEIKTPYDFGDAPEPYPTLLEDDGPSHRIVTGIHNEPGVHLGYYVDPDMDGQPDLWAIGDDDDAEWSELGIDDEDGVLNFDFFNSVHGSAHSGSGKSDYVKVLVGGMSDFAEVVASTDGFLHAWVDFNGDGDFGDPTEQIAASVPLSAGVNRVHFSVPWLVEHGESFARFRFTSIAGDLPWYGATIVGGPNDGVEVDGEVEDYEVWLEPGRDFGDAPDAYGDAMHHIADHFYLGHKIDGEAFSLIFDGNALGDDTYDGHDDEDGVDMKRTLMPGTTHEVTVFASAVGYLRAWVDFDGDESFDSGDLIFDDRLLNPGENHLTFVVPADLSPTKTFARFRFSETTGTDAIGYPTLIDDLGFGEVEDYEVSIGKQDFGDAPDEYRTLEESLGAAHVQITDPAPYIGGPADMEHDGQPTPDALGDDQVVDLGDLYAGISFGSPMSVGAVVLLDETDGSGTVVSNAIAPDGITGVAFTSDDRMYVSTVSSSSSPSALWELDPETGLPVNMLLHADNSIEIVDESGAPIRIIDLSVQPLSETLFGIGGGGNAGELYIIDPETGVAELIGDTGQDSPGGIAFDWYGRLYLTANTANSGVETYLFQIDPTDASEINSFEVVDGGGTQIGITLAGLGYRPDDGTLYATSGVSGGDVVVTIDPLDGEYTDLGNTGVGSAGDLAFRPPKPGFDDEDGVFFDESANLELGPDIPLVWGKNTLWVDARTAPVLPESIDLPVPGMGGGVNNVDVIGFLNAWIDFNRDGDFQPSEQIAVDLPMVAGEMNPVPFTIPSEDFEEGLTFARFRISSEQGLSPWGLAADGEVEDYQVAMVHEAKDFGDAPDDDYRTLLESDGARHVLPQEEVAITHNGFSNLGFEDGLLGWETGGTADHVEVLESSNFTPGIEPTEGDHFVLLSTGPGLVTPIDIPSLDPPNSDDDHDSSLLWTSFNLDMDQVPAVIAFDWNFLTSELSSDDAYYGGRPSLDDFFDVSLNGVSIANGSVYRVSGSGFDDTGPYDGVSYEVSSDGPTDGSYFADGQTGWQTFQFVITDAGNYTLKFTVADQETYVQPLVPYNGGMVPAGDFDTGLLIDNVKICVQPEIEERLRLGSYVDAETDGQPTPAALGDDLDRQGDDEDGVTFTGDIIPDLEVPITVEVAGVQDDEVAFLDGWIDYNQDGDFDDFGEQFLFSTSVTNGIRTPRTVRVPTTVEIDGQTVDTPIGMTYARIRISSQGQLTPGGEAADGEVEDYLVFVGNTMEWLDYGDAPDDPWIPPLTPEMGDPPDYVTLLGDADVMDSVEGGARHAFDPNTLIFLGEGIDLERDGQPAPMADGDDGQRTDLTTPGGDPYDANDDEDGITFPSYALVPDTDATIHVTAGTSGYLDGWIDYDMDGEFEPSERIADGMHLDPGTHELSFSVPSLGAADEPIYFMTYARFRFSGTSSGLPPTGWYENGEVEDYKVNISNLDFGDAFNDPEDLFDYPTQLSHDGARHILHPDGPILGWTIDAELDGQPTVLNEAIGDDQHGIDDEDGIFLLDTLIPGDTVRLVVNVVNAGGWFYGWMDHNGDLEWDDDGERLVFDGNPAPLFLDVGTHTLSFDVPSGTPAGLTSLRFRITSDDSEELTTRGLAIDGEVEDYVYEVFDADFGDAPDSFGTSLAMDGPRHALSQVFLGSLIDAENDALPDDDARSDDNLGVDDEDGVVFAGFLPDELPALATGSFVDLDVVSSVSDVYLNAWIDFDGSGVFGDSAGEHVFADETLAAGSNALTFFVEPSAMAQISYARFRVSSEPGLWPTGPAGDGEVEDYKVLIERGLDFGDAPEPDYSTLLQNPLDPSSNDPGPYHEITGLYLGDTVDAEDDGQPHEHALGDDLLDGNDDEDGVWFSTPLVAGSMASVSVVSSLPGYLNAWIDFRRDGDWDDNGEHVIVDYFTTGGGMEDVISFPVPDFAEAGELTYARFRISSYDYANDDLGPDGIVPATMATEEVVPDGEVEDYQVVIGDVEDWGDAPDGIHDDPPPRYPTLEANLGVRHAIVSAAFLGQSVDPEEDGQPDDTATGDDLADLDDEDGVTWLTPLIPSRAATVEVTASVTGFLNAWIDFNGDGDWNDPNEWIASRVIEGGPLLLGGGGPNVIEFWVPETAVIGETFSRFRFEPIEPGTDVVPEDYVLHPYYLDVESGVTGEVEDHLVVIDPAYDFGDADNSYLTLLEDDGPRHVIVSHYHLGLSADEDADGQPGALALGDDLDDDGDDEDGVVFSDLDEDGQPDALIPGMPATIEVTASSSGKLDAWIDVDGDGVFEHPGEQILAGYPVNYGVNTVTFDVPLADGNILTSARFRMSLEGGLTPTGMAANGEVEDYLVELGPGPSVLFDYGDAPDPYPTLLIDDGARHVVEDGIYLGNDIDIDPNGQPAEGVDGDDGARTDLGYDANDDEDGVTFTSVLLLGEQATLDVVASVDGMLDAWIDFNNDGDFLDDGEQIFNSESLAAGSNSLDYDVPDDAVTGMAVSRFRFSTAGGLSPSGPALDGEVEDHPLIIPGAVLRLDLFEADGTTPILDGEVHAGEEFFVRINTLDNRANSVGIIGLNVDLGWVADEFDYVGVDIDPGNPAALPITESFPSARTGSLDQDLGLITLAAFSIPAAGPPNAAIGAGAFEGFSMLLFRAEPLDDDNAPITSLFDLTLNNIVMADNADVIPAVEDAEVTVVAVPGPVIQLSHDEVRFTTEFTENLDVRNGTESPLVRPNYPDTTKSFTVTNNGGSTLQIDDVLFDGTLGGDVTVSPQPSLAVPVMIPVGMSQTFDLVFAPTDPVTPIGGATGTEPGSFDLADGLMIVSNAINDDDTIRLIGASTFNCDISYDGACGLTDRNLLENPRFFNNPPNYDPTLDMDGDGRIDLPDAGVLNVEFAMLRPTAEDDAETTMQNVAVNVDVADNDLGVSGLTLQVVPQTDGSSAAGGAATLNDGGTPGNPADDTIDFAPTTDFIGDAHFYYGWFDGADLASNVALVEIDVQPAAPLMVSGDVPVDQPSVVDHVCMPLVDLDAELDFLFDEAVRQWSEALPGRDVSALVEDVEVRVQDLGGSYLGLASADLILIDDDAAGYQWYVDQTPADSSEFTDPARNDPSEVVRRIDLLSVLVHELGHVLGFEDVHDPAYTGIMASQLGPGVRRWASDDSSGQADAVLHDGAYESAADQLFADFAEEDGWSSSESLEEGNPQLDAE